MPDRADSPADATGDQPAVTDTAIDTAIDTVIADAIAAARKARRPTARCHFPSATADVESAAHRAGFHLTRELLQLRRTLPLPDRGDLDVRPIRVGSHDEARWLEVNNRAFSWHPEQSGWSLSRLHDTMAEPWFDSDGMLLHHHDGALRGFCWTKVHAATATDPAMGEIFVIGVDPRFHGQGLGRALTLAGLAWLADRGLEVGMLYVEADNAPARHLYESLGFTIHHREHWYELDLRAVPS